jgi:predicted alpha/beta hydrolase
MLHHDAPDVGGTGPVVIINPATSVRRSYYSRFAAFLCTHGFSVITYDYRGIVGSRPEFLRCLQAGWLDWGRLDFEAVLQMAFSTFPATSRFSTAALKLRYGRSRSNG